MFQAARYTEWLEAHPIDGQEPWEQGLTLAFGKKQTAFDIYEKDPKAGHRFGLAMGSLSRPGGPMDAEFVLRAFDWSSLGDATVVDLCPCLYPNAVHHNLFMDIYAYSIIRYTR